MQASFRRRERDPGWVPCIGTLERPDIRGFLPPQFEPSPAENPFLLSLPTRARPPDDPGPVASSAGIEWTINIGSYGENATLSLFNFLAERQMCAHRRV